MTLKIDSDPGGSQFLFTICNECEADDTADENILKAKGWGWTIYAEPEGPHWCPDCAPIHLRPDDDEARPTPRQPFEKTDSLPALILSWPLGFLEDLGF